MTPKAEIVTLAYVGWSNVRGGTELYSEESGGNGRWAERRVPDAQKWGDLLVDELAEKGVSEGSYVVVVAFPSRFDKAKAEELRAALSLGVLARLCVHGRFEAHAYEYTAYPESPAWKDCRGGSVVGS